MGWWLPTQINLNQVVAVSEGSHKSWGFNLQETTRVDLYVAQHDGPGINIAVMEASEYSNFQQGNVWKAILGLSFDNVGEFSGSEDLPAGTYYLVAWLPRTRDNRSGSARAAIRCESLHY